MSDYRINVRFRMNRPEEAVAAEFLKELDYSKNDFIIDAILTKIYNDRLLRNIRQIFREEVLSLPAAPIQPVHQTVRVELTEAEKEENMKNVLADLDMFG